MSDVKFNCPLKNKPIAEGKKKREKERGRERERERGRGGERERGRGRGVCNKTILRNHEATPRAGLL